MAGPVFRDLRIIMQLIMHPSSRISHLVMSAEAREGMALRGYFRPGNEARSDEVRYEVWYSYLSARA